MPKEPREVYNVTDEIRWVPCTDRADAEQCERKYIEESSGKVVWFCMYVWGTTQKVIR